MTILTSLVAEGRLRSSDFRSESEEPVGGSCERNLFFKSGSESSFWTSKRQIWSLSWAFGSERWEVCSMKHPSLSIRKYRKHPYGWECLHWDLSSYKFPVKILESSNGQDESASTEASEDQLSCCDNLWHGFGNSPQKSTDLYQVQEISKDGEWWYHISDTSKKRCVWRSCRNANEPVAEITDLSLQNMPKGKQVWVSGV